MAVSSVDVGGHQWDVPTRGLSSTEREVGGHQQAVPTGGLSPTERDVGEAQSHGSFKFVFRS